MRLMNRIDPLISGLTEHRAGNIIFLLQICTKHRNLGKAWSLVRRALRLKSDFVLPSDFARPKPFPTQTVLLWVAGRESEIEIRSVFVLCNRLITRLICWTGSKGIGKQRRTVKSIEQFIGHSLIRPVKQSPACSSLSQKSFHARVMFKSTRSTCGRTQRCWN